MRDHYAVGAQTANERSRGLPLAGEFMRWLITEGHADLQPVDRRRLGRGTRGIGDPDMQCTLTPGSFKDGQIGELDETPGLSAGAWQMRPLSRGYVEAKSNRTRAEEVRPGGEPARRPCPDRQRVA
jgi:choline dehydrogenase